MAKKERIVIARSESRTDWARVKAVPQEEVERLADEEDGPLSEGWEDTIVIGGLPPRKRDVHIRFDADVLDWFRGYQTRINAVLRAFVDARRRAQRGARKRRHHTP